MIKEQKASSSLILLAKIESQIREPLECIILVIREPLENSSLINREPYYRDQLANREQLPNSYRAKLETIISVH